MKQVWIVIIFSARSYSANTDDVHIHLHTEGGIREEGTQSNRLLEASQEAVMNMNCVNVDCSDQCNKKNRGIIIQGCCNCLAGGGGGDDGDFCKSDKDCGNNLRCRNGICQCKDREDKCLNVQCDCKKPHTVDPEC